MFGGQIAVYALLGIQVIIASFGNNYMWQVFPAVAIVFLIRKNIMSLMNIGMISDRIRKL